MQDLCEHGSRGAVDPGAVDDREELAESPQVAVTGIPETRAPRDPVHERRQSVPAVAQPLVGPDAQMRNVEQDGREEIGVHQWARRVTPLAVVPASAQACQRLCRASKATAMLAATRKSRRGSGTVTLYRSRMAFCRSLTSTTWPVASSTKSKWKTNGTQMSPM